MKFPGRAGDATDWESGEESRLIVRANMKRQWRGRRGAAARADCADAVRESESGRTSPAQPSGGLRHYCATASQRGHHTTGPRGRVPSLQPSL